MSNLKAVKRNGLSDPVCILFCEAEVPILSHGFEMRFFLNRTPPIAKAKNNISKNETGRCPNTMITVNMAAIAHTDRTIITGRSDCHVTRIAHYPCARMLFSHVYM